MLVLVRLQIVLILTQDRCTACAERTIGLKSFWTHQIEHLGDMGYVESHFGPFRVSVSIGARLVHGMRQTYHNLRNRFERTLWFS
jgi:hypothetical protein